MTLWLHLKVRVSANENFIVEYYGSYMPVIATAKWSKLLKDNANTFLNNS